MKDDEETGFIDVVGPPDIKTEPDSEPREWYVKRPSPEISTLPPGTVRLENGAVVTFETAERLRVEKATARAMELGDTSWAEMCPHMRAVFLLVEASPVELSGSEGVNMFCRTCDRTAIDTQLAAGRSKGGAE